MTLTPLADSAAALSQHCLLAAAFVEVGDQHQDTSGQSSPEAEIREVVCQRFLTDYGYLYNRFAMSKPSRRLGRRLQVRFRPAGGEESSVGYTTNISATGMFVATIRPLPPGTELDLEVSDRKRSVRLYAVVVHARKVPATWQRIRPSGMGVRFLDSAANTENLRQLVGPSGSLW